MSFRVFLFLSGLFTAVSAPAAQAQSSLGVTGLSARIVAEDADALSFGDLTVDVAITEHHGLQGDLALVSTDSGTEGRMAAHLYMMPVAGHKYGLFAFAGDFDGRSAAYGGFGAEGLLALDDRTAVELRAGLGLANGSGLDFLFAEGAVHRDLGRDLELGLSLSVADIDELDLQALSHAVGLSLTYRPDGQPWGAFAEVSRHGLSGRDGAPDETTFRAGLTLDWGTRRTGGPETRPYSTPDPLRPVIRRGLF